MKSWFLFAFAALIACSSDETNTGPGSSGAGGASASTGAGTGGDVGSAGADPSSASSSASTGSAGASPTSGTGGSTGSTGSGGGSTGSTGGGSPDASSGSGGAGPFDGSSGRPDARPEVVQACTAFAAMFCAKVRECTPFVLGALYGDTATCENRVILGCVPTFDAPGTSASPAKTSGCGQAIAGLACATFLTGDLGASCKTDPGTIANGGACGDDAQCVSTFCARAPDAACGVCAPATRPNDPCVRGACSAGTVCPAGQSTCITPTPGKVDDACTAQEQCDLAHGVGCNAGSGKCLSLTLASAQGTCGANSVVPTSYAVCPATGTCSAPLGGRCSAAATEGQACSTADTGTHCLTPARCVASKCVVPDPIACR